MLIYSAMRGCRMTTRRLLRAGADVGDVSIHGNTPLHFAAMHGYEDVVRGAHCLCCPGCPAPAVASEPLLPSVPPALACSDSPPAVATA